eukprot:2847665-Rhodomonas_salina.1
MRCRRRSASSHTTNTHCKRAARTHHALSAPQHTCFARTRVCKITHTSVQKHAHECAKARGARDTHTRSLHLPSFLFPFRSTTSTLSLSLARSLSLSRSVLPSHAAVQGAGSVRSGSGADGLGDEVRGAAGEQLREPRHTLGPAPPCAPHHTFSAPVRTCFMT